MSHLYAMYGVEQSTTMPYNPHRNAPMEMLNHTLIGLLKSLSKEHKSNWPLHLPLLVFAYNAMPHDMTGYQRYELMSGHKAPTICNAWLGLANYNDNFSQGKCAWVNKQHELILAANRQPLKRIKASAEKLVSWVGGKALDICNLVLLCDHPEGCSKFRIITKMKCLSWNQSTRTQMFISSNHSMVRVLCIWWTGSSYSTFISHRGVIYCLIQPLIPNCLLYWSRNPLGYNNSPTCSSLWYQVQDQSKCHGITIIFWGWDWGSINIRIILKGYREVWSHG